MARQKKQTPEVPAIEFNEEAFKAASDSLNARSRQLAPIDKSFGDLVEYQLDRVVAETKFFFGQGSESFFQAGRRLLLIKEHEDHGNFIAALERIGIDRRAAAKLMSAAARFGDLKTLGTLPRTKLFELTVLDDEDLDQLDKGGTVAGIAFDDVDRMGVRELRAALRKERTTHAEDNDSNEKLLEKKDKKLNELVRQGPKPWDDQMVGLVDELHTCSLAAVECLRKVLLIAQAAAIVKIDHDEEMFQKVELARRCLAESKLLVDTTGAVQAFIEDHFVQYVEGVTFVMGEPYDPGKPHGKKG